MFEDATFESTGSIRTHSRDWMPATLALNGMVLMALALTPLIHPELLPRRVLLFPLLAPPTPVEVKPVARQPEHAARNLADIRREFDAPSIIPEKIYVPEKPEPRFDNDPALWAPGASTMGSTSAVFSRNGARPVVRLAHQGPVRVSSRVVEGYLIHSPLPRYPPIAKTLGVEGTVVLQATISKEGVIEHLHVVSGHPMLRQAAQDAVQTWRYRPFLLNGKPVEVETTVNVVFKITQ